MQRLETGNAVPPRTQRRLKVAAAEEVVAAVEEWKVAEMEEAITEGEVVANLTWRKKTDFPRKKTDPC